MSSASALPVPAPGASPLPSRQVPCERCGSFTDAPVKFGPRDVCDACATLLRKETRLYSFVYMRVVGFVLNFTVAAVLAAINWKRLGERERMRNALILGAFGVAWTGVAVAFDIPFSVTTGVGIGATLVATNGLKEPLEAHWKAGGARANGLWPVLITLGVYAVILAGVFVFAMLAALPDKSF